MKEVEEEQWHRFDASRWSIGDDRRFYWRRERRYPRRLRWRRRKVDLACFRDSWVMWLQQRREWLPKMSVAVVVFVSWWLVTKTRFCSWVVLLLCASATMDMVDKGVRVSLWRLVMKVGAAKIIWSWFDFDGGMNLGLLWWTVMPCGSNVIKKVITTRVHKVEDGRWWSDQDEDDEVDNHVR